MEFNIIEVIVYLLELEITFFKKKDDNQIDWISIKKHLEDCNFPLEIVNSTFDWLKNFLENNIIYYKKNENQRTLMNFRIFNNIEQCWISLEIRNLILSLEINGILDEGMREIIINQLMISNYPSTNLTEAKLLVLIVLLSKFNKNIDNIRQNIFLTMTY